MTPAEMLIGAYCGIGAGFGLWVYYMLRPYIKKAGALWVGCVICAALWPMVTLSGIGMVASPTYRRIVLTLLLPRR